MVLSGQLLRAGACRRGELNLSLECLMLRSLSCEKLNEFRWFRTKPRFETGASSHSCWVPSASHSTLVGLSWSQYLLSSPSLPQMSSLLEKILYFLSCLVLKVTRTGVEHLRLAGEKGHLESGSRGPRNRGMQGTPSSHHSSPSAVLLEPPRVPRYTPSQGERPTATPGSLHFASAFLRGRRSDSTRGGGLGGRVFRLGPVRTRLGLRCRARSSPIASCPRTWTRVFGCGWQT